MDESEEQPSQPEFGQFLENIELHSSANFNKLKDRVFEFYYEDMRKFLIANGKASQESSKEEIKKFFEPNPEDTNIEDLRFAKAFLPYSISDQKQIPDWVPELTRKEILEDLAAETKGERYYANNVVLGLVQLLQDEGLVSSSDPHSPVQASGITGRGRFEQVLSKIGGQEVYPTYAVVEKQETDSGYMEAVRKYGQAYDRPELGIIAVLKMKSRLAERATFTFCDSTYYLTEKEREQKEKKAYQAVFNTDLPTMLVDGTIDAERKLQLEEEVSRIIFPDGKYRVTFNYNNFHRQVIPTLEPTSETMAESILGVSVLKPAFELSRKLKEWQMLDDKQDYLEAQILGRLTEDDCEGIIIQKWIIPYLEQVLAGMPQIEKKYNDLVKKDIIRINNEI